MQRQQILAMLKQEKELLHRRFGVKHLALFGSLARDQATEGSDVDLLVEFDRPITLFDLVAVKQYLETTLAVPKVDVVPRDCIFPEFERRIVGEAIDVA